MEAVKSDVTYGDNLGYIEANGYVKIEAEHYSEAIEGADGSSFGVIKSAGMVSDAMKALPDTAKVTTDWDNTAKLVYRVYFEDAGTYTLNLRRRPVLNEGKEDGVDRTMNIAVGVENDAPTILKGNRSGSWDITLNMCEILKCNITVDKRGTVYGIYEMSAYFGVSPWYYFADVPVRKKDAIVIPDGFARADYPCVQYRGIFLNDEEELEEWAVVHTEDGTIGPELYEKIYELILRLKGNYLWPAMHVNYFQENPESAWLANEMGIVIGTSHCDMLMRSNQNEWTPWLNRNGYKSDYNAVHSGKVKNTDYDEREVIYYDYSVPGHNREVIRRYWRESVEMNKDYEVCYTIGMRGVHDYGFSTKTIDQDESLSDEEKLSAKVKLLEDIMADQRQMIRTECNLSSADKALQSFIPYKEVLTLYNAGLKVPDDVTLIWVNDNFGHIRRYPDADERKRSGGHGLYFHASYWGTTDMSYLFFNTMPLAHTTNELRKLRFTR